jgi:ERCC4-type nuclease
MENLFKLNIVIDTREQTPWSFPDHMVTCRRGTLKTGDYALVNDNHFAIERKNLDDFIGSIFSGWNRFLREVGRMDSQKFPAKIIIVESDYEKICFTTKEDNFGNNELQQPQHNHIRITPQAINKRIAELSMQGVSVLFAGNPGYASALAYAILSERNMELINGN